MHRVINNMKIVRLFSFIILIGAYLSADSNSGNLPAPIPIDFGVNYDMRSDSTICESCNQEYDAEVMGASCCDEATFFNSIFTCEVLETTYLWNCSGCTCTEDDSSWTTDFGCMDEIACNYNSDAIWDDTCLFTDGNCQTCIAGEVMDNDDDGDNVCNEDEIVGCQDNSACNYNSDATEDDGSCEYAMENYDCDGNCTAGEDCGGECGGSAEVDECGVCGGDGIPAGACDCDGNVDLGCGCGEAGPSGCDNECGSTVEVDECGECGGDGSSCGGEEITDGCDLPDSETTGYLHLTSEGSVLYKSLYAIGGFQFDVDGATINSGSGGDMAANGLLGNALGTTFLAFSLSGGTIPAGCGTLVNLDLSGDATGLYNIVVSDATGSQLYFEYYEGEIPGCTDMDACNYNADATEDDGSCEYAMENYDCDGNCTLETDCAGECGGSAEVDECGECGGDGIPDGACDCAGNIDLGCGCGEAGPSGCDNECGSTAEVDECGECGGDGMTECPDGSMECDASDCEEEPSEIDYTLILDNHHNLVSFYSLPEEVGIAGIMSGLGDNVISVMTEGESAANLDGVWIGSLIEFSAEKGFWISINNFPDNLSVIGIDMDPDRMYELHDGANLISFPDSGSTDLSSAIPDDVEHLFTAILTEGISAMNLDNGWIGSLTGFQGGVGYWVIVEEDLSFSYNTEDLLERSVYSFLEKLPNEVGFNVAQSSRQAFYYVDGIKL
ncbi:uncharacterized protein METZ01_LOCUS89954, partial [marine metagenome]